MSVPQRLAVSLPQPPDAQATIDFAQWAEAQGFDDVWFTDGGGQDALTVSAAVALATSRVRIGTAVIPAYTRTPAVFASTAMSLSQLSGGRFVLGLGASSHAMIEGWHGLKLEKPLTRVRETAQLVRSMLKGEKSGFAGETLRSQGFRLSPLPVGEVPVYLAALRAKMLEMAGEFGDGVVLNLFPEEALPRMLEHVDIGARRADSSLAQRDIVCRYQIAVIEDESGRAVARQAFRQAYAPYYATPVYNRFLAWSGYETVADTITKGWQEKDRDKTTAALDDELVDKIAIIGTADECRERVRRLAEGGITTHIISTFGGEDAAWRKATFEAFAPEGFRL